MSEAQSVGEIMEHQARQVTKICKTCNHLFQVELGMFEKYRTICDPCLEKDKEQQTKEMMDEMLQAEISRIKSQIPAAFYEINEKLLPDPSKLNKVLEWKYGPRGLLLHGETGKGKSRCAWQLIKRELSQRRSLEVLDSMAAVRFGARYSESCENVENWMDDLITSELVFMDDIFKNKLTDAFEGFVFAVIDQRMANMKPIIVTCNDTGETLSQRMSDDRAKPILRRLRECCVAIAF